MRFGPSQFSISFTQKGVFLDRCMMNRIAVDEDDIVETRLFLNRELTSQSHSVVKAKEKWDLGLEKSAYGKTWYSQDMVEKLLRDPCCIVIGYVDWNNLVFGWNVKALLRSNPTIELEKYHRLHPCKKVLLKILATPPPHVREKVKTYEFSDVLSEQQEIVLWLHTERTKDRPINLKRTGLESLPLLGTKRRKLLMENGINTILELVSSPLDELSAVEGISYNLLEKWVAYSSKALYPSAHPLSCKVFLTEPRGQKLVVTNKTVFDVLFPYYSQFFVRGHPVVEPKILDDLQEGFEAFYTVTMPRERVVTLLKKDGTKEVNISGPWIVEMSGFEHIEAKSFLDRLKLTIQSTFGAWDGREVILLIGPQETWIEPDQILESLVEKLSVQYAHSEQVLWKAELGKRIVVDTNILIDGRLSSLIVRAVQGTLEPSISTAPEIIIPNVVTYEIKSMIDRPAPKEVQYRLADTELLRLRALHDAGYIRLRYAGDIPQLPPIMQYEKGTWRFFSSLRDEYILKALAQVDNPTLVTQDGRLARSAYARGFEVILIKPLIRELKDEFGQEIREIGDLTKEEQENLLTEIGRQLLVSKDTIMEILKVNSSRVSN